MANYQEGINVLLYLQFFFLCVKYNKKRNRLQEKNNKIIQTHTKAYILFPRPHQLLFLLNTSSIYSTFQAYPSGPTRGTRGVRYVGPEGYAFSFSIKISFFSADLQKSRQAHSCPIPVPLVKLVSLVKLIPQLNYPLSFTPISNTSKCLFSICNLSTSCSRTGTI